MTLHMNAVMLLKKVVPPRFELGSREPESHMLPLHHGTFLSYLYSFPFTMPSYPWPLTPSFLSPYALFPFPILSLLSLLSSYSLFFSYSPFPPSSLLFLPPLSHFFPFLPPFPFLKKTPPVGLEPTTLRLKAARSTDWARKALTMFSLFLFSFFIPRFHTLPFPYSYSVWQRGRVV